jgi:hypothetical protein
LTYTQIGPLSGSGIQPDNAYGAFSNLRSNGFFAVLAEGDRIRIQFAPPTPIGTRFRLRLTLNGGLRVLNMNQIFTVPEDGNFDFTLRASDFGLTPSQMSDVVQIAVLSGEVAGTGDPLNQTADKKATFSGIWRATPTGLTTGLQPGSPGTVPIQPIWLSPEQPETRQVPLITSDKPTVLVSPNPPSQYIPLLTPAGQQALSNDYHLRTRTPDSLTVNDAVRPHGTFGITSK